MGALPDYSGSLVARRKQFHQVVPGREPTPDLNDAICFGDGPRGHPIFSSRLSCAFLQLAFGFECDCRQAENKQDGSTFRFAMPEIPFEIANSIEGAELLDPETAIAMLLLRLTMQAPYDRFPPTHLVFRGLALDLQFERYCCTA